MCEKVNTIKLKNYRNNMKLQLDTYYNLRPGMPPLPTTLLTSKVHPSHAHTMIIQQFNLAGYLSFF